MGNKVSKLVVNLKMKMKSKREMSTINKSLLHLPKLPRVVEVLALRG